MVDGVLYCFCMEKDLNSSGELMSKDEHFTEEFLSLLRANLFGKKLGMMTLFPLEWHNKVQVTTDDVIEFYKRVYIIGNAGKKSRETAREIVEKLKN